MLESFEKMKWEDIYSYWKASTEGCVSIVNRAPLPRKIAVKSSVKNRIYTNLWLNSNQLDDVKCEMNHLTVFLESRCRNTLTDERVMRAADLLVQAKSDEERAAIWIWIFCSSLENAKLPYPNSLYIDYVGAKSRLYLQDHFKEWVFKYHHRFPQLFVGANTLSKVKFERYSVIVDFAIMNAYMVCKEYSIALFDSEPEADDPPYSYHNLRKE
ncbi:MAG: hypothetical protein IJ598_00365 [Ruminococcus sp.]|nr:hypothetical protein [Ruminococcus sp.]